MPYLMRYILLNKIGVLPYRIQKEIKYYNIRDRVMDIDERKMTINSMSK
jgi:hypothetical protein